MAHFLLISKRVNDIKSELLSWHLTFDVQRRMEVEKYTVFLITSRQTEKVRMCMSNALNVRLTWHNRKRREVKPLILAYFLTL